MGMTWTPMTVMTRRNRPRKSPASSVISVTASISMTQRTVPPRHRCPRTHPIPHIMAVGVRSGLTVRSVRCLGTGRPTAMMTRPSDAVACSTGPQRHSHLSNWTPALRAQTSGELVLFLTPVKKSKKIFWSSTNHLLVSPYKLE